MKLNCRYIYKEITESELLVYNILCRCRDNLVAYTSNVFLNSKQILAAVVHDNDVKVMTIYQPHYQMRGMIVFEEIDHFDHLDSLDDYFDEDEIELWEEEEDEEEEDDEDNKISYGEGEDDF